jgi:hypothetical protein
MVWEVNDGKGLSHERISPVNFVDYRGLMQVFEDAAAWWYPQLTLTETGHEALRVRAIETTPNCFSMLGVQPVVGALAMGRRAVEPAVRRLGRGCDGVQRVDRPRGPDGDRRVPAPRAPCGADRSAAGPPGGLEPRT